MSVALVAIPQYRARRRLRELLSSGDLNTILDIWDHEADELPHHRTTGPLARATALAAHGMTEKATEALGRSARGGVWEQALEHRLFVEVLVDAFEGRREDALKKAATLRTLPLPASPWTRGRAVVLRNSAEALARAFGHCSQPGDTKRLAAAARHHPLVHWAMRYAQAIVLIDRGKNEKALKLMEGAPEWPEGSAFNAFHAELAEIAQAKPSRNAKVGA